MLTPSLFRICVLQTDGMIGEAKGATHTFFTQEEKDVVMQKLRDFPKMNGVERRASGAYLLQNL